MKVTILVDNQTGVARNRLCASEWRFSAFIEIQNVNILFDTGHSDIFKNNAKNLKINLDKTHFVILSHHHWDHAKGLLRHDFKDKKKLIMHPDVLNKVPRQDSQKFKKDFEIVISKQPLEFSPNIYFLGQIPRRTNYERGMYENDKSVLN